MADSGRVIEFLDFRWDGVAVERYKDDPTLFRGVTRQVLLGSSAVQDALNLELRYFEVEPGGFTTLERHDHTHAVVVLRGRGTVVLDSEERGIQPHDCVYVPPDVVHQFRADLGSTLGFICVVDRVRDRAQPIDSSGTEM